MHVFASLHCSEAVSNHTFTVPLYLQKEALLRSIENLDNGFGERRQWLEDTREECKAAAEHAGKDTVVSIRAYARSLEQAGGVSGLNPEEGKTAVSRRLCDLCDKVERMNVLLDCQTVSL